MNSAASWLLSENEAWRERPFPTLFVCKNDLCSEIQPRATPPPHVACVLGLCWGTMAVLWTQIHGTSQRIETFHHCGNRHAEVNFRLTPAGWMIVSHRSAVPSFALPCQPASPVLSAPPGLPLPPGAPARHSELPSPPDRAARPKRPLRITAPEFVPRRAQADA